MVVAVADFVVLVGVFGGAYLEADGAGEVVKAITIKVLSRSFGQVRLRSCPAVPLFSVPVGGADLEAGGAGEVVKVIATKVLSLLSLPLMVLSRSVPSFLLSLHAVPTCCPYMLSIAILDPSPLSARSRQGHQD